MDDCAGGIVGLDGSCEGVVALGLRDRAGLADLRSGSGEAGVIVLDLGGSSTMYMSVSMSRNSTHRGQQAYRYNSKETHQKASAGLR